MTINVDLDHNDALDEQFGGTNYTSFVSAFNALIQTITGKIFGNYKETRYAVTTTGDVIIDLANGNVQRFTLDAAREFTMPPDPGEYAQSFVLILECATFTPTWAADPALEWLTSDGAAPTLATSANLVNALTFIWDDADSRWLGFLAGKETA